MNLALLLHLIRKDLRWRRREIAALWALLVLGAAETFLLEKVEGQWAGAPAEFWLNMASFLLMLFLGGLLVGLQLDFIHADHPRSSDAFLLTRPVGGPEFALAKLLAWLLVAALPALLAVLLRLFLLRLDLRADDYVRVTLRSALLMFGTFGMLAMVAVIVRKRRPALAISAAMIFMVAFLFSTMSERLWENLSEEGLHRWVQEKSRLLAMACLVMGGGYVLVACALARSRLRTALVALVVMAGLCVAARFFWPVNLVWREDRLSTVDPARLAELQKQTVITAAGALEVRRVGPHADLVARASPLTISGWNGSEWPEVVAYQAGANLRTGEKWKTIMNPVTVGQVGLFAMTGWRVTSRPEAEGLYPPLQLQIPMKSQTALLGLPSFLADGIQDYAARFRPSFLDRILIFDLAEAVPTGVPAHVTGAATMNWYRPVLLASLPLKRGSTFVHDGRRVRILAVSHGRRDFSLHLSVVRSQSLLSSERGRRFDADPAMVLCVANPARGQIAILLAETYTPLSSLLIDVEAIDARVSYEVRGGKVGGFQTVAVGDDWLAGARLYVMGRQGFGQTRQSFQGDFVTSVPVLPPTRP